jgi:hypothetical protein
MPNDGFITDFRNGGVRKPSAQSAACHQRGDFVW